MPSAFYVVSRVLARVINAAIAGACLIYVDDIMGCCTRATLTSNLAITRAIIISLLGPLSVEDRKTEFGRVIDFLGWEFDLDRRSVAISRANFLKTFYGFVTCTETQPLSVRHIQRLASWASRYSAVLRHMKPFTADLFALIRGYRTSKAKLTLSDSPSRPSGCGAPLLSNSASNPRPSRARSRPFSIGSPPSFSSTTPPSRASGSSSPIRPLSTTPASSRS